MSKEVRLTYTRHRKSDYRGRARLQLSGATRQPRRSFDIPSSGGRRRRRRGGRHGQRNSRRRWRAWRTRCAVGRGAEVTRRGDGAGSPRSSGSFAPAPRRASSTRSLRWAGRRVAAARSRRARRETGAKTSARPPNKLRAPTTAAERLPRHRARDQGSRVRPCAAVRRVCQLQMTAPRDPRGSQRSSRRRERRLGRSLKHVS